MEKNEQVASESAIEEMIAEGMVERLPSGMYRWTEKGTLVVENLEKEQPELFRKLFNELLH